MQELRRKLNRRFLDDSMIDEQLSRLSKEGLQSDARFAESYLYQRTSRGYGPARLKAELRERGVSDEHIRHAMHTLSADWCEIASQVMQKKFGGGSPVDVNEKSKRLRFLQYRGFSHEHYQSLFRG